ncbi:ParB N-terminal domain-containing protein (plasmid) [Streptomyces sp. NBC_01369]|uniref:ParB/RepB/Spo0J family partition protein n=1 Tax=Streptomyces sp. NBC_01369 TaxID=2903842 RepID=UPI002F90C55E
MSNHDEFDEFIDDDDEAPIVDTRADGRLLRVPLPRLSPNRVNPRKDFGSLEELEDFGRSLKRRQIQALPVVTRTAYLKLWPKHEEQIGNVDFVIVSGERRFRGASAIGLPALECVINDDVAETRKTFLDAVVSENIDRQNFDAIEEANAVDVLVEAFGTARAVAEHYERGDAWVSQRRVLLRLAPEAQDLVRRRELPLEYARKLGKLVKDHGWEQAEQLAWWEKEQQRQREKKSAAAEARRTPPAKVAVTEPQKVAVAPSFTAVKTQPEAGRASDASAPVEPASAPATQPDKERPARKADTEARESGSAEASLPEPRQGGPVESSAADAPELGESRPDADWVLPPGLGWEPVLHALMAGMGELDRHKLTKRLSRIMEEELVTAPQPSSP